jgi:hypothetical protein
MRRRSIGALLAVVAAVAYLGFVLPARRAAADAGDEDRRARERKREALARLARVERVRASRQKAASTLGAAPGGVSLVELRKSVLASLAQHSLSDVHLRVIEGRAPVLARVSVSAEGSFIDVVSMTGGLVRAGGGLVLDRVRVHPRGQGVVVELEALRLGSGT